ncbi:MAG: hypothetical protein AB8G15_21900 [Saprospiraceae bacterium]
MKNLCLLLVLFLMLSSCKGFFETVNTISDTISLINDVGDRFSSPHQKIATINLEEGSIEILNQARAKDLIFVNDTGEKISIHLDLDDKRKDHLVAETVVVEEETATKEYNRYFDMEYWRLDFFNRKEKKKKKKEQVKNEILLRMNVEALYPSYPNEEFFHDRLNIYGHFNGEEFGELKIILSYKGNHDFPEEKMEELQKFTFTASLALGRRNFENVFSATVEATIYYNFTEGFIAFKTKDGQLWINEKFKEI